MLSASSSVLTSRGVASGNRHKESIIDAWVKLKSLGAAATSLLRRHFDQKIKKAAAKIF